MEPPVAGTGRGKRGAARALVACVLAAGVLGSPAGAQQCRRPPEGGTSTPVGTLATGPKGSGVYAGYLTPDGDTYVFAEAWEGGVGVGAGRGRISAYLGAGPGYPGFNEVCLKV